MTEQMATISIVLESEDDDQELLDMIGQQLHNELREEYGPAVQHQSLDEIPEGAKSAIDMTIAVSSLVISVAASHREISRFADLMVDCLWRARGSCRKIVTVDGHDVVLKGRSDEAIAQVIEAWERSKAY